MDDATLEELFASVGSIAIRRMFGGKGIYSDGRIIAVVLDGELMLKTDAETAARFEAADSRRWTYAREGRAPVAMPYHALPDEAFDDPDIMAVYARLAVDASVRAASAKPEARRRHEGVKPAT